MRACVCECVVTVRVLCLRLTFSTSIDCWRLYVRFVDCVTFTNFDKTHSAATKTIHPNRICIFLHCLSHWIVVRCRFFGQKPTVPIACDLLSAHISRFFTSHVMPVDKCLNIRECPTAFPSLIRICAGHILSLRMTHTRRERKWDG